MCEIKQQDEPVTVQELLGRFEDYKWVPDLFDKILAPTRPLQPARNPNPDKIFDKSIPWKTTTKLRLWVGQDSVPLNTFYTVRDGNPDFESAPARESVWLFHPRNLFQVTKQFCSSWPTILCYSSKVMLQPTPAGTLILYTLTVRPVLCVLRPRREARADSPFAKSEAADNGSL